MSFGFFRNNTSRATSRRPHRRSVFRAIEQLEDRRMLANAPPNLAAIANTTGMTGREVVITLNVSDADGAAAKMFFFFNPDKPPVNTATIKNAPQPFFGTPRVTQLGAFLF